MVFIALPRMMGPRTAARRLNFNDFDGPPVECRNDDRRRPPQHNAHAMRRGPDNQAELLTG
jgi:hypothetical protein